ncbi:hypothetical protein [Dyella flagellata]|uniref:hypothetical protein n=1 Tax=Dyella flagellata TaxID=1867833 RepID=UPI0024E133C8|nr:hypothetical protein [Dyella flagellata]
MKLSYFFIFLAISCLAGLGAVYVAHLNFWTGFLIGACALLVNGAAAEFEDRRVGRTRDKKG